MRSETNVCKGQIPNVEMLTAGAWPGAGAGMPLPAARPMPGPPCTITKPFSKK